MISFIEAIRDELFGPPTVARIHQEKWNADRRERWAKKYAVDPKELVAYPAVQNLSEHMIQNLANTSQFLEGNFANQRSQFRFP